MGGEHKSSTFTSDGREPFPPLYADNEDVRNFSDEKNWPTEKLIGRFALYHRFLERLDLMPRARRTAQRILNHIDFEFAYRSLYLDFDFEQQEEDDCPTQPMLPIELEDD